LSVPNLLRIPVLRWFLLCCPFIAHADDLSNRVIILANSADPDSVHVARHYAEARHVPEANIISLEMPLTETIAWTDFLRTIWEPLEAELVRLQWIDAIPMRLVDTVGRTKYAVSGHRISYLVTCRGVPLRIMHDPALFSPALPYTENTLFRTNAGAVDAELSLLARPGYSINAFVPNPLYRDDKPTAAEEAQVIKVSRIDGPTVEDALGLVDLAIEGERTGLLGRAYVDIGGKHQEGERWLEAAATVLSDLGFDTDVDRSPTTIPATARFDAPVLYFGWYASAVNGPFKLPGFRFPPGAIALHIHSYSAETLHSAESNWCGPLIARGVTATVGNVFEPYLQLTHRPDLLLRALVRGETFGDAVFYAEPVLSWQTIAIGDPLYRPFAFPFEAQWSNRAHLASRLAGYATARKMKELTDHDLTDQAIALGRDAQRETPTLVVAYALAELLQASGDVKGAANALSFLPLLENYAADELGLASRAAAILLAGDQASAAVDVYRTILRTKGLLPQVRSVWLGEAYHAATAARNQVQAAAWKSEADHAGVDAGGEKK
jgi:uncharacterized protein (TIGR03790 family)